MFFRIKKGWWDQIPNPARSHLVAIIIQDAQVGAGVGEDMWDCVQEEVWSRTPGLLKTFIGFWNGKWTVRRVAGETEAEAE